LSPASGLEIIPLGTGNYFSTLRFHTSLVLLAGETTVLVDCPEPLYRMCALASESSGREISPENFNHVIITHLHGDHCNGLEGLGYFRKFIRPGTGKPRIYTSHEAANGIWQRLSPAMSESRHPKEGRLERFTFSDYFDETRFEMGDSFQIDGLNIETRSTIHTLPCFGIRASFGGRKFGYSSDTSFDPDHIKFLEPCDLIFHECDGGTHTPLESLESLPESIRKKMRLIHLGDHFQGSSKIESAVEGKLYTV
jgi:ribonuclease BN (tRNA processing enzyme)